MDRHDLNVVLRELKRAPDAAKRRAIHLIRSTVASLRVGPIDELEMDALAVPEEVFHAVYYGLTGAVIPTNHARLERAARDRAAAERASARVDPASFSSLYWFKHVKRPGGRAHLRDRHIVPSRATQKLVRECVEAGHTLLADPPACVRPATHFGRSVGMGMFALAPLARGQMITQFTGTVHPGSGGKGFMAGNRADYVINARYKGREYTIDPLDAATHRTVAAPHFAAYINEPSRPPFASRTNARHVPSNRNVLVKAYEHRDGGTLRVEFADGRQERVPPEDLAGTDGAVPPRSYRANCAWFDFPVPLDDLYRKTKVKDNGLVVYARTALHGCTVTFRGAEELVAAFETHTNQAYSFEMHRGRAERVVKGDVLSLRDEVMDGLRRHGVVVGARAGEWDVYFRVDPEVAHRLPRVAYAGPCEGRDVPFPCIHACSDVRTGDELLCLYSTPLATRGLGCRALLAASDFRLPWHEYVQ